MVALLQDDERLKNERTKALKAKERFAQNASGFGSDGSIDGPTHREVKKSILFTLKCIFVASCYEYVLDLT